MPAADSQLKLYIAAYGDGSAVSGGTRVTTSCSSGTGIVVPRLFSRPWMGW